MFNASTTHTIDKLPKTPLRHQHPHPISHRQIALKTVLLALLSLTGNHSLPAQNPSPAGSNDTTAPNNADSSATTNATPTTPLRSAAYLIWTQVDDESGSTLYLGGEIVHGPVWVQIEANATGPYTNKAVAETETTVRTLFEQLKQHPAIALHDSDPSDVPDGSDGTSTNTDAPQSQPDNQSLTAKQLLPPVKQIGTGWWYPWQRPASVNRLYESEKDYRESSLGNHLDPRDPQLQLAAAMMGTLTEEQFQQFRKTQLDSLDLPPESPFAGVLRMTTAVDQLRIRRDVTLPNSAAQAAQLVHERLHDITDFAVAEYQRAQPKPNTDGQPKSYIETHDQTLTLKITLYKQQAPLHFSRALLEDAVTQTPVIRERGRQGALFHAKQELEKLDPKKDADQVRHWKQVIHNVQNTKSESGYLWIEEDEFWKWYPTFSELLEQKLTVIDEARSECFLRGTALRQLSRSNRALTNPVLRHEMLLNEQRRQPASTRPQPPRLDQKRWQQGLQLVEQQKSEYFTQLEAINAAWEQARDAATDIENELDTAIEKYGAQHPELYRWKKAYRLRRERLSLELAVATENYQALFAAMQANRKLALLPETRMFQAEILIDKDQAIDAIIVLRETIDSLHQQKAQLDADLAAGNIQPAEYARRSADANPNHPGVHEMLKYLEVAILKSAMRKSQGAIGQSRAAFYQYLSERGFTETDKQSTLSKYLQEVGIDSSLIRDMEPELMWAAFTTGVTGSVTALGGKADAQADATSAETDSLTDAWLGLHAIIGLRLRNHSLAEIKSMTSQQIITALPRKNLHGKPYTAQQAKQLGVLIHEAMQLPDVQALVEGDPVKFVQAVNEGYWDPSDVGDTWAEWFGDVTSPKNLIFMLTPYSVASVEGNVAWFSVRAGQTRSGTEAFARVVGWERAVARFGNTAAGQRVLRSLEAAGNFEQSLNPVTGALFAGGKLAGAMAIGGVTMHLAEEHGGPVGVLLAESLLLLAGDGELMLKLLRKARISPAQASRIIRTQMIPELDAQLTTISHVDDSLGNVESLLEKMARGESPTADELEQLKRFMSEEDVGKQLRDDFADEIPNGQPSHDRNLAIVAALDESSGPLPELSLKPLTAADEFEVRVSKQKSELQQKKTASEQLVNELDHDAVTDPPDQPFDTFAKRRGPHHLDLEDWRMPSSDDPTPIGYQATDPAMQARIQEADELLFNGQTDEAANLYNNLVNEFEQGSEEFVMMKRKHAFALRIAKTPRGPPPSKPFSLSKQFEPGEIDRALALRRRPLTGGTNDIFETEDGQYLVKVLNRSSHINPDLGPNKQLMKLAEAEVIASDLARELGLDVPAAAVKINRTGDDIQEVLVVYRKADAIDLKDLDAEVIFQYRDELSSFRAFALWLNDHDRHFGNFMRQSDGRLIAIDWGLADPRGFYARSLNAIGKVPDASGAAAQLTAHRVLYGKFGRDGLRDTAQYNAREIAKLAKNGQQFSTSSFVKTMKRLMAEEGLTYNAAEDTIGAIHQLIDNPDRLEQLLTSSLQKVHGPDADVVIPLGECLEYLAWRDSHLDEVLEGLNTRNNMPLPKSAQNRPPRDWKALATRGQLKKVQKQFRDALESNDLETAEELARKAMFMDRQNVELRVQYGGVLFRQGRFEDAAEAYQTAIRLAPDNPALHDRLGITLYQQKQPEQAASAYRQAISLDPKNAEYHNRLAIVLGDQKQWDAAEQAVREALKLNPDRHVFHANLAEALLRQGQREAALKEAREAVRLGLKRHAVYEELGID